MNQHIFKKKTVYIPLVLILLYALSGFVVLPLIGKQMLPERLSRALNRRVSIEKIAVNPFALTARIDGLKIDQKEGRGPFFEAERMFANLSLTSILSLAPVLTEFRLDNPHAELVRQQDGGFNFSDLLKPDADPETSSMDKNQEKTELSPLVLKNLELRGGRIGFSDQVTGVTHQVKDLSILIPFASTKKKFRQEKILIKTGFELNGSEMELTISSALFEPDIRATADIKVDHLGISPYLPYLPLPEQINLSSLDLSLGLRLDYQKTIQADQLSCSGRVNLENVLLNSGSETEYIRVPGLSLSISSWDISNWDVPGSYLKISDLDVTEPEIVLTRTENGQLNWMKVSTDSDDPPPQPEVMAPHPDPQKENQKPFSLILSSARIRDGRIRFKDLSNTSEFATTIFPLNVSLEDLVAKESVSGRFNLDLETESKEKIETNGRFQSDPGQGLARVEGRFDLTGLSIGKYMPYYDPFIGYAVKKGRLNLSAGFDISGTGSGNVTLQDRGFELEDFILADPITGDNDVSIPEFSVKEAQIDLETQKISLGKIETRDGSLFLKRLKNGGINLEAVVKQDEAPAGGPDPKEKGKPWELSLPLFVLENFDLVFTDDSNQDPVKISLSDISISAEALSSVEKSRGHIDARMNWNKDGRIRITGEVMPADLSAGLELALEKIDIESLQPYFTDAVRVVITDGAVNVKGSLGLNLSKGSRKKVSFTGKTAVANLIALDKKSAAEFFTCKSFYLSGIDMSLFPVHINASAIALTDFYSRIAVDETGALNLSSIFKQPAAPEQTGRKEPGTETQESEPARVSIGNVTIQGGNIQFSDAFTKPNFSATMKEIAGSVTGLSSEPSSRADIHLKGIHGNSSPLDITGTMNLLSEKKHADIDISFKDIELTNFTPYSSKYLGYKIQKGKLILDLEYLIDGNELKSENHVRLDNFHLGERVESEQATSMPIGLAVALLKNQKGEINLDLPVSGNLDDPEFSVGGIVLKMLSNLMLKVVTSPFSIIGAMFGGGEELGWIEFDYGEAAIREQSFEKIDKIAQILQDKPSIKLEIQGEYDKLKDAESLREKGFENFLKAEKLKRSMASASGPDTLEDVTLSGEEREDYAAIAYEAAEFPKPRDEKGKIKTLDIDEKIKLLKTHISIGEKELNRLALDRSEQIKAYLLSMGKIEKERIFILSPRAGEDKETQRKSTVRFSLR